jgi:pilus assembly protein CpaE
MAGIRALVAVDSSADREVVQEALPASANIEIVGVIYGLDESWNALQEAPTDLVVVACRGYSDRTLFFINGVVKQRSDRPIVVLAEEAENGFVRRIFEAGADDVVVLPESPERVSFTLQKAIARRQGAAVASGVALAPMVCILGPKGGTGKTLTSCNLAVALAGMGKRTVLVDLDLQFGDVGLSLGLSPEKTIYDLAKSGGSLDFEKLDSYLTTHSSGAKVLLAPTRPDQASFVTVDLLRDVYTTLRANYDFVVVDTPPGFTPEVIASIDSSSHVCMVGMLDSLSLKNTKLGLETLELMGYDSTHVSVVLNRADSKIGISRDDVAAIVGRSPDVFVPSDRQIPKTLTEGLPIVAADERSDAAAAFRSLAKHYIAAAAAASTNGHADGARGKARANNKSDAKDMLRTLLGRR